MYQQLTFISLCSFLSYVHVGIKTYAYHSQNQINFLSSRLCLGYCEKTLKDI